MTSKNGSDAAEFNLPEPTAADLVALDRADGGAPMDPYEYLEFLVRMTKDLPPSREIDGPWPEPFEL